MTKCEIEGARILVNTCGCVKPGENVVVITDTNKISIAEYIVIAAQEKNAETVLIIMSPRETHGEEPPKTVVGAVKEADVVFAVTTFSLFHTKARQEACKNGARWINLPDFRREMLCSGGLYVDFLSQRELVDKLASILLNGSQVKVITERGTDIEFSIKGRSPIREYGICDKPGMVSSPPDIEVCIAPVEGTANGKIVVDGSIVLPEIGPLSKGKEVILTVKDGFIREINGGTEARKFKKVLETANDPSVYNIAEFGIGLNPMCELSGSMLEDEGVYGTIHFGIGDNHTMGGITKAPMHIDVVIKEPTVIVDGKIIIDHGEHVYAK
ncbi:aminopeptidase [Thermococcus aggregans]|uniref:Aminopeptidase n=1 Tax=Thermococcus aggregans TaxID=110163 RepID=A0A9E7MWH4_THEAG|nr:aminopeptidase [Thermococcus aggregans]USS40041.1 aminopeptidase [Thermococcus aggregans]